ncbi:hypothetical protein BDB01DRAFT_784039 [Pilobolus umbonatus]|nr:hypothetical protein BDB01DRAFT_784039 [Pilobolus umbonatus]
MNIGFFSLFLYPFISPTTQMCTHQISYNKTSSFIVKSCACEHYQNTSNKNEGPVIILVPYNKEITKKRLSLIANKLSIDLDTLEGLITDVQQTNEDVYDVIELNRTDVHETDRPVHRIRYTVDNSSMGEKVDESSTPPATVHESPICKNDWINKIDNNCFLSDNIKVDPARVVNRGPEYATSKPSYVNQYSYKGKVYESGKTYRGKQYYTKQEREAYKKRLAAYTREDINRWRQHVSSDGSNDKGHDVPRLLTDNSIGDSSSDGNNDNSTPLKMVPDIDYNDTNINLSWKDFMPVAEKNCQFKYRPSSKSKRSESTSSEPKKEDMSETTLVNESIENTLLPIYDLCTYKDIPAMTDQQNNSSTCNVPMIDLLLDPIDLLESQETENINIPCMIPHSLL